MSGSTNAKKPLTLSDAEGLAAEYGEDLRHRSRQLQLAVGVANGAGFTAVAAKVLDALAGPASEGAGVVAILFPSAMLFAAGMLSVGVSAWLDVISAALRLQKVQLAVIALATGGTGKYTATNWSFGKVVAFYALEAFGGLLFMAGVGYPLAVLGARYAGAGAFTC